MDKFNVLELLSRLADAVNDKNKHDRKGGASAPPAAPQPPVKAERDTAKKDLAVIEMIRNHDKLSRAIDEKNASKPEEKEKTP